jgi:hypothetical protein
MPFKAATVTMTATTVGRMIKLQAKAQMLGQGFVWGELVNADGYRTTSRAISSLIEMISGAFGLTVNSVCVLASCIWSHCRQPNCFSPTETAPAIRWFS